MAKKQNIEDLGAGLTFGSSQKVDTGAGEKREQPVQTQGVPEPTQPAPAAPVEQVKETPVQNQEPAPGSSKSMAAIYANKLQLEDQPRTVRIQAVVTQNTATRLDELVKARKIRSRNDLINFLLEGYLEQIK